MDTTRNIRPARFLSVLWDGGGNVSPQLIIARHLVERGHEVRVLAPKSLQRRIEDVGCSFLPYRYAPEHDSTSPEYDLLRDWEARTPLGAAARVRDRVMAAPALDFARDVLAALEDDPADIVIADYLLVGAYLGAERAAIPMAALIHHIYPFPDPSLPPFGLGLQPSRGMLGHRRNAILRRMFVRFYDAALPTVNDARSMLRLPTRSSMIEMFSQPERLLVLSSRAFDLPSSTLPPNVRYVGAQLDDEPLASSWTSPWPGDDCRPLVVVSFSTTYQRQAEVLHRVVDTLATLPVRALVTAGPAVDAASVRQYPNVVVQRYVPHRALVPHANLVITHGGHGTVMTSMASGVPVLCLPMGRDQGDVAARAIWRGAGVSISPRSGPDALGQAIMRILTDASYRNAARRIADDMAHEDGEGSAIEELECLSNASRPLAVVAGTR